MFSKALAFLAATLMCATSVQAASRPNIVLILADDMGFSDIGCFGGEISTPNIDSLAARGVRFTQFYNAARCCPTRSALLTGLYPHQAGVGDMMQERNVPAYMGFLNDRCATIAELLRANGYATLMSGKWHVGEKRPHWPVDRGFEQSFTLISGACNYYRREPARTWAVNDQPIDEWPGFYMTDAITDHAVRYLNDAIRQPDKPFFLYLAYTAPHWPLHALEEDIAKYRGRYRQIGWDRLREQRYQRQIALGIVDPRWALSPRDSKQPAWDAAENPDELDLRMAVYAAQIDRMDQGIGKVLAKLKDAGVEDNTLVLFLSDNGGSHEVIERSTNPNAPTGTPDSFRSYGVAWANASNTPFRKYKHWTHEGGISTPLLARWPAVIKQEGASTNEIGHVIDLLPTFLDAAGVTYPKSLDGRELTPLAGRSLLPLLKGDAATPRGPLFWEHEGSRAVRDGKWKLVAPQGEPWELYDMAADRTELHDVSGEQPEKFIELQERYAAWAAEMGVVNWPKGEKKGGE